MRRTAEDVIDMLRESFRAWCDRGNDMNRQLDAMGQVLDGTSTAEEYVQYCSGRALALAIVLQQCHGGVVGAL